MKINNVELKDIDLLDADVAEKYENAINKLADSADPKEDEELSLSGIIRKQCKSVFNFFNDVFGEGTDIKVFGKRTNYRECESAFKEVIDYTSEQKKEIEKLTSKYSPNRAQRRSDKQ